MNWTKQRQGIFFFTILLVCCFRLTYGLYDVLDICLVDEHNYLLAGIRRQLNIEYAPLYTSWYYLLSHVADNNTHLMFLNFKILTILFPVAMYWFLIKLRLEPLFAFLLAFLLLYSQFNLPMAPKVVIFMNLVQIIILSLSASRLHKETRNILIAFFLFISYYIRPEYKISFLLFFVFIILNYFYQFYKGRKPEKPLLFIFLIVVLTAISLGVGFPFKNQNGKQLLAFGSSYALNYVKWHHSSENAWSNWFHILKESFGNVSSPAEALRANPALFLKHVFSNIRDYIWIFTHLIIPTFIPVSLIKQSVFSVVLLLISTSGIIYYHYNKYTLQFNTFFQRLKKNCFVLSVCTLLLIPNALSILIITTRYHYISLELPAFATLIAILCITVSIPKGEQKNIHILTYLSFFVAFLFILITPLPAQNSLLKESFKDRHIIDKVNRLNELKLNDKDTIKSLNCDILLFTQYKSANTSYFDKFIGFNNVTFNVGFYKFLNQHHFNFIVVDNDISNQRDYHTDKDWQDFLIRYDSLGFSKVDAGDGSYYLIRKDILPPEGK